jgi:hypothetical protein
VTSDPMRAERLEAFLSARRVPREQLVADVGEPFGRPLLVVATGSIVQGFGNHRSDIDIYAIVERDVSLLPIPAYTRHFLIHNTYFGAADVETWVSAIRDHPWPSRRVSQQDWGKRRVDLGFCTNFACGLMLEAQDGWSAWLARFAERWLATELVRWWRIESLRRQLAGRWLAYVKPFLAAQNQFEAVLALLQSRAAAAGQLFFGPKWISEKFRVLGDRDGLEALREIMRVPATEQEAKRYAERCEQLLSHLGAEHANGLGAQVWYLSNVRVRPLDERVLVSRWNLRGVELRRASVPGPNELFWEGDLETPPPADVIALLTGGMAWVSIVATAP